jgi:hypothetical protein
MREESSSKKKISYCGIACLRDPIMIGLSALSQNALRKEALVQSEVFRISRAANDNIV